MLARALCGSRLREAARSAAIFGRQGLATAAPGTKGEAGSNTSSGTSLKELSFDQASTVYGSATSWELLRAILVFRLSQVEPLVANARRLMDWSRGVFGDSITDAAMRATFFGHFCAGRDADEIRPTLKRLQAQGVGSILDYAAEADVGEDDERELGVSRDVLQARTYDYQGEEECDFNVRVTLRSIETAAQLSAETGLPGFAAVKVTSIGKPELLQHVSQALAENRSHFLRYFLGADVDGAGPEGQTIAGREAAVAALQSDAVSDEVERVALGEVPPGPGQLDLLVRASEVAAAAAAGRDVALGAPPGTLPRLSVSMGEFADAVAASGAPLSRSDAEALFLEMDVDGSGSVDTLEWSDFLSTTDLARQRVRPSLIVREGGPTELGEDELRRLERMVDRARTLADAARAKGVTIMFDAEQTYLQPAIDHVVTRAQAEYNSERAVVYNTYQAYLRDAAPRLTLDIERARRRGFRFGAKLVRGAYMVQERKRASDLGYRDPVQPDLASTHANYDAMCGALLDAVAGKEAAEMMVASHNEASVRRVAASMDARGVPRRGGGVSFGQLLGMCDHVSMTLGHEGFAVYKYVPYGPVKDVLPYLVRRAEENSGMLSAAGREIAMRSRELRRRSPIG